LKVDFKKSFLRDLKRIKETHVKDRLRETIESIENAKHFQEISHLSKIKYGDRYYRIRIGDYRLGLILEGDTFILVRFLHRKDLYRYFP
jgi:mRNA interferase RelE/StbE